ncbi:hypothetical protein BpHYR1_008942 [Brachionus plicatilis]|uniref:Uncharacterized protein n=1 Tax=Brachionus plicatilis TaxID=10195 RepID=A0A3M7QKQ6_BRAPC|nr:hypothetical protein BpHYR1_008942 [Brachionus plicatilis]
MAYRDKAKNNNYGNNPSNDKFLQFDVKNTLESFNLYQNLKEKLVSNYLALKLHKTFCSNKCRRMVDALGHLIYQDTGDQTIGA